MLIGRVPKSHCRLQSTILPRIWYRRNKKEMRWMYGPAQEDDLGSDDTLLRILLRAVDCFHDFYGIYLDFVWVLKDLCHAICKRSIMHVIGAASPITWISYAMESEEDEGDVWLPGELQPRFPLLDRMPPHLDNSWKSIAFVQMFILR